MHGRDGESGSGRIGSCKFASDWMGPGSAKRLGVVQDGAHHLLSRRVTAASFYEIYEWVVDDRSGRHLFIGETDTITDLADGFRGAALGRAVPRRLRAGCSSPPGRSRATRAAVLPIASSTSSSKTHCELLLDDVDDPVDA